MDELTVLDPTAELDAERIPLAPRPADLAGIYDAVGEFTRRFLAAG